MSHVSDPTQLSPAPHRRLTWWPAVMHECLPPVILMLGAALFFWGHIDRLWIPHDEGTIAHAAERVLLGELPHRDFDEPYTGGLTFLNAAALRVWGEALPTFRYPYWFGCVLFAGTLYLLARPIAAPWPAAGIAALAASWGMPHSFSALPSWYNLFFAGLGTAAVFQFLKRHDRRWLLVAGLCGGLSICFKIIGVYFVGAMFLFVCYWEQTHAIHSNETEKRFRWGRTWYSWLVLLAAGLYAALVLYHLRRHWNAAFLYHLALPNLLCAGFLIRTECTGERVDSWRRWRTVVGPLIALSLGVLFPLGMFASYFAWHGALTDLVRGVLILPQQRLDSASFAAPSIKLVVVSLPLLLGLAIPYPVKRQGRTLHKVIRIAFLILSCWLSFVLVTAKLGQGAMPHFVWGMFPTSLDNIGIIVGITRTLAPLLVGAALAITMLKSGNARPLQPESLRLVCITFVVSGVLLVQYPFAAQIYFLYYAPLLVLLGAYLIGDLRERSPFRATLAAALFVVLSLVVHDYGIGTSRDGVLPLRPLTMPRGRLAVLESDVRSYEAIYRIVQEYSSRGDFIYAAPDCPEIYFLCERRNPTRTFFDFFDVQPDRTDELRRLLADSRIPIVVENRQRRFSQPLDAKMLALLPKLYRQRRTIEDGHQSFVVWFDRK